MAERVRRTKRPTLKAPVGAPGRGLSGVIVLPVWDGDLMATAKSGLGSSTSRFQERGALDQKTAGRTGALNKGLTSALVDARKSLRT